MEISLKMKRERERVREIESDERVKRKRNNKDSLKWEFLLKIILIGRHFFHVLLSLMQSKQI